MRNACRSGVPFENGFASHNCVMLVADYFKRNTLASITKRLCLFYSPPTRPYAEGHNLKCHPEQGDLSPPSKDLRIILILQQVKGSP